MSGMLTYAPGSRMIGQEDSFRVSIIIARYVDICPFSGRQHSNNIMDELLSPCFDIDYCIFWLIFCHGIFAAEMPLSGYVFDVVNGENCTCVI